MITTYCKLIGDETTPQGVGSEIVKEYRSGYGGEGDKGTEIYVLHFTSLGALLVSRWQ